MEKENEWDAVWNRFKKTKSYKGCLAKDLFPTFYTWLRKSYNTAIRKGTKKTINMENNCSNHKKEVAGISDMKLLAEMIGDLHYKTLAEFLDHLSTKVYNDGLNDFIEHRPNLGNELFIASNNINDGHEAINRAWQISKPFMEKQ